MSVVSKYVKCKSPFGELPYENGKETTDKEASAAIESRINYIIKVADGVMPKIAVTTAKGNTVVIGDKKYNTANEDEAVTLNITLGELEVLEGIYYNADDASSLTTVDKLVKDSNGGYVLNMMRGGGMLVGLKIHKHTPGAAVRENETAAGYDSVVYCTTCGAELSRSHTTITPSPIPTPASVAPAAPTTVFRFATVDENTEVHGVKVADHKAIEEVFSIIGAALDDENATLTIPGLDKVLTDDELTC